MSVTVYTKPDCVQCKYTKVHLERNMVPYNEIDVSKDDKARKYLQDFGITQLPVVVIERDHHEVDRWVGFKLEKLRGLRQS
jgi:glutaredoxin-like protein NrdH